MAKTQFIILHGLRTDDFPDAWSVGVGGPLAADWILGTGETASAIQRVRADLSFFVKRLTPKPGNLSVGLVAGK